MIVRLSKALGGFAVLLAVAAILAGVSLFVFGAYLTTWPILRLSPAGRKQRALARLATDLFGLALAFKSDTFGEELETRDPSGAADA